MPVIHVHGILANVNVACELVIWQLGKMFWTPVSMQIYSTIHFNCGGWWQILNPPDCSSINSVLAPAGMQKQGLSWELALPLEEWIQRGGWGPNCWPSWTTPLICWSGRAAYSAGDSFCLGPHRTAPEVLLPSDLSMCRWPSPLPLLLAHHYNLHIAPLYLICHIIHPLCTLVSVRKLWVLIL